MADGATSLLMDALERAAAAPEGMPLFAGKKAAGLFAASASARKAAQLGKDDGLFRVLRSESKGRSTQEVCAITEKGLQRLLEETNPKPVLDAILRAIEARRLQLGELVDAAQRAQGQLETLRQTAEKALERLHERPVSLPPQNGNGHVDAGPVAAPAAIVAQLSTWHASGALDDCPLPQLHRNVAAAGLSLTVGQFHDALRRLQERGQIYLHPWTGPMYQIPEPVFALMVGHEVAYYASLRSALSDQHSAVSNNR